MNQEKLCPNCNESIEEGAVFCGNCGFRLINQNSSNNQVNNLPTYSKSKIYHRKHWPGYSIVFGIVGVASSLFIPIIGFIVGICAIVLSTSSVKHKDNRKYRIIGLVIGIIALLVAILSIAISANHSNSNNGNSSNSSVYINTSCYTIRFSTLFNFNKVDKNSCDMVAYYGANLNQAIQYYRINATYSSSFNASNLNNLANNAITSDISTNLKGYQTTYKNSTTFDGSSAYYVSAYNPTTNNSVVEEVVYHPSLKSKYNLFIIVRSEYSKTINLNSLAKAFVWR